jgi:hypothetical protein
VNRVMSLEARDGGIIELAGDQGLRAVLHAGAATSAPRGTRAAGLEARQRQATERRTPSLWPESLPAFVSPRSSTVQRPARCVRTARLELRNACQCYADSVAGNDSLL